MTPPWRRPLLRLAALTAATALAAGACSPSGRTFPPPGTKLGGGAGGAAAGTCGSASSSGGVGGLDLSVGTSSDDPATCADAAAKKTYIGCDFWPTPVANNVWSIFDFAAVVANTGTAAAKVTVTRGGKTIASAEVAPSSLVKLYLPWVPEIKGTDADVCGTLKPLTASITAAGAAYHLVSTVPVTVYQFNALEYAGEGGPAGKDWSSCPGNQVCAANGGPTGCYSYTNDASLLLPSTAMTGNYRITSQKDWKGVEAAYFAITGTQANTDVTVVLAPGAHVVAGGTVADTKGGGKLLLKLNAGDVAELVSDRMSDLAGSLVQASAPVQVISGMPCAYQPFDDKYPACDHLEQTVFPAETLGKHYFVTAPTAPEGGNVGHIVRLVGNVDGTKLSYPSGNQPPSAPTSIGAGEVADLGRVSADFEIVGDHEFAVVTFMLGASLIDPGRAPPSQLGDPSQSNSAAVEQYRVNYVFLAPSDYTVSYVDIVQPMGATVTLDDAPACPLPTAIGSGYGVARVLLGRGADGAHVLVASEPVGIQVIGYGAYTSYQYPGGLDLKLIAPPPPPPK